MGASAHFITDMLTIFSLPHNHELDHLLQHANALHPNLKFTYELEDNQSIPFLDLKITRFDDGHLKVAWYKKRTDTNVLLNNYSLAPEQYKKSLIRGMVHRLFYIASDWNLFDSDLNKAKRALECNQCPPSTYNPLIRDTITRIVQPENEAKQGRSTCPNKASMFFLQYRGRPSDWFKKQLKSIKFLNVNIVFTMQKLRSVLPSLKCSVPTHLKSHVIYEITCPGCSAQYVGQTQRHLKTRCKEHANVTTPVGSHFKDCVGHTGSLIDSTRIIDAARNCWKLSALEAIHIAKLSPTLNSREEFRQRHLSLRF